MSPWVDDPETGTSVYERPKKRKPPARKGSLAELAAQHNAEQEAKEAHSHEESFGQRMARIKREKHAALVAELAAAEMEATYPGEPGDGKDPL